MLKLHSNHEKGLQVIKRRIKGMIQLALYCFSAILSRIKLHKQEFLKNPQQIRVQCLQFHYINFSYVFCVNGTVPENTNKRNPCNYNDSLTITCFGELFYKINESGRNSGHTFTPTVCNMCETGPSDTLDEARLEIPKHVGTVLFTTVKQFT